MDRTAISTKDTFRRFCLDASDAKFKTSALDMLASLRMTEGLWAELDYLYKAAEICEWMIHRVNSIEPDSTMDSLTLYRIKRRASLYADRFRLMHNTKDA